MSSYIEHAKKEFKALGYTPLDEPQEDGPNKWIQENVIELLKVFSDQGHSGSSAPYCVGMFRKLALFEPLGPLTGEDSEWGDFHGEGETESRQNTRCSHVFQRRDGSAYDINGCIFVEPTGSAFTGRESWTEVDFPYTPKKKYAYVKFSRELVLETIERHKRILERNAFDSEDDRQFHVDVLTRYEEFLNNPDTTETEIETKEREARGESYTIVRMETEE